MKRKIWIVSEGSPGHISQSEGLAGELGEGIELDVVRIETRHRFGGFVRMLVRTWMGKRGKRLPDWFLKSYLSCDTEGKDPPDMIIVSGGKAVFAARSLALAHAAPVVYIGERKPYPSEWFDLALTPSPLENGVNDLGIELIPTGMKPGMVDEAAAGWEERPAGCLWAMLVGGSSASHRFTQEDWLGLGKWMNGAAREHSIRWLLTTSRRTGTTAEAWLREALLPEVLASHVWWAEKPEKYMAKYLGSSERVFVTQDSVTMVSEAVLSGRPVCVLFPQNVHFPRGTFLEEYYARLERGGRISRFPISKPPSGDSLAAVSPAVEVTPFSQSLLARLRALMDRC